MGKMGNCIQAVSKARKPNLSRKNVPEEDLTMTEEHPSFDTIGHRSSQTSSLLPVHSTATQKDSLALKLSATNQDRVPSNISSKPLETIKEGNGDISAPENGELATSPTGSGLPESYSESFVTV